MKLIINGQLSDFAPDPATPFLEVINEAKRLSAQPGQSTVQVIIDDEDITGQDWSRFREKTAADIQSLELVTRDVKQVAREALDSLNEYIPRLSGQILAVAEGFRTSQERSAAELYSQVLDGLQLTMHTELLIRRNLGSDTTGLDKTNDTFIDSSEKLGKLIEEMLNAQERGDWILLADLLEYELAPHLEDQLRHINEWRTSTHG
ncbi:MAG: hypothetical protein V2A61_08140 [Calditrichota bacterium]